MLPGGVLMRDDLIPRIAALLVACALLLVLTTRKEHRMQRFHIRFEVEYGNRLD
jgi:hypothetical protein